MLANCVSPYPGVAKNWGSLKVRPICAEPAWHPPALSVLAEEGQHSRDNDFWGLKEWAVADLRHHPQLRIGQTACQFLCPLRGPCDALLARDDECRGRYVLKQFKGRAPPDNPGHRRLKPRSQRC